VKRDRMGEYRAARGCRRVRGHNGKPGCRLIQCRQANGPSRTGDGRQGDRVGGA